MNLTTQALYEPPSPARAAHHPADADSPADHEQGLAFYLGTHEANWFALPVGPLFVSHRRLMLGRSLPRAGTHAAQLAGASAPGPQPAVDRTPGRWPAAHEGRARDAPARDAISRDAAGRGPASSRRGSQVHAAGSRVDGAKAALSVGYGVAITSAHEWRQSGPEGTR